LDPSLKFNAVRLNSAPGALAEQIIKHIQSGKLKPGTALPSQRELAKMFKVGLGSVREAIKILDVMGYLDVIRGKGTFVADDATHSDKQVSKLDKALEAVSLANIMKARQVVECACARLAADAADPESIERLKGLTMAMEASFHDKKAFYELDFDFHVAVAEATNNKVLFEIVKLLVDRAHNHIGFMDNSLSMSMPFNVERAVGTARSIVNFIAAGDGDSASDEMHQHLNIVNWELEKEFLVDTGKKT
jgi:GntR family transcriptional repressor for pyruvate dehydrogenase complex